MQNTAQIDHQKLLFGNYATRRFCRLQECTNDPTSILMEFGGDRRADALFNLVRAGVESALAEAGQEYNLTDFQISAFIDKINAREDKGDSVVNAFIGSVLNKPATEVPDWIKQVEKDAQELAKTEKSPNVAGEVTPSQLAKKSKSGPTATV